MYSYESLATFSRYIRNGCKRFSWAYEKSNIDFSLKKLSAKGSLKTNTKHNVN